MVKNGKKADIHGFQYLLEDTAVPMFMLEESIGMLWSPGAPHILGRSPGAQKISTPCHGFNHSQMREDCEKQEKYFKGKVVTFTVQCLILYQYPVDLLTFFELYERSSRCLKMVKFGLVDAICQSNFVRVRSISK